MDEQYVIKRDGRKEVFCFEKIANAIDKAIDSTGEVEAFMISPNIVSELEFVDGCIDIEKIQDFVETLLMKNNLYETAKAYIRYRENRRRIRENAEMQRQFINNFMQSDNTANATIDDNSNVSSHNIAVLNSELHKEQNKQTNLYIWEKKIREMYPELDKNQFINDVNTILYPHDLSGQVLMPYTYSSKEVIEVMYNSKNLLLPIDLLYEIVDEKEELVDNINDVYQKTPWNLYVKDDNDFFVKVTKLTRKKRHRPLVRVKTSYGEDIVVTDNHPMIVNKENIENTIEAKDSLGCTQYKTGNTIKFKGNTTIDLIKILPSWIKYEDTYIKYNQSFMNRIINVNRSFGYLIGFFIGDGCYNNVDRSLGFIQKEKGVLNKLNTVIYEIFGVAGNISKSDTKFSLKLSNHYIYELFRGHFKIQDKAQNKTLPYNILEYNEEFAKGILEGLIDADGTVKKDDCAINIRLSSRACILQCSALFRYFKYSVGNSMQSLPFSNNTSYNTNYTIWGINATKRDNSIELNNSIKVQENLIDSKSEHLKYKLSGYCNITDVSEIEEKSSFYLQNEYIYDITTDSHTFCSNNILVHNCAAISLYPFLNEGLKGLGGLSAKPSNLDSFCGIFINLVFKIASEFKGAVATPAFFVLMDYFIRKEFGDWYYKDENYIVTGEGINRHKTVKHEIIQRFQQITYSLNQPSAARGNQSIFWNLSFFDKNFFEGMYGTFVFPDGSKPKWEGINYLQKLYLHWLNQERLKCVMTFPVTTCAMIYKDGEFKDKDFFDFVCQEYSEGNSFFTYISDSTDSLSSCCRLRNKITTKEFNFTNGNVGEMTGSKNVITLDINRIVQQYVLEEASLEPKGTVEEFYDGLSVYLTKILDRVYKYQEAYNELLFELYNAGMYDAYSAGFISLNRQYLTIGVNGLTAAAECLEIECTPNEEYKKFTECILGTIKRENAKHKTNKLMFNTELVPAESAAIKLYNRDKKDGYWVPEDINLYTSYMFKPYDESVDIFDKIKLHGKMVNDSLDGGIACHINLAEHLTKEQYAKILNYAGQQECSYLTFNVPNCECKDCGFIKKVPFDKCPECGSENVVKYDRIIGYLTAIPNWSRGRQIEQKKRVYSKI